MEITPRSALKVLLSLIGLLLIANLAAVFFEHVLNHDYVHGFVPMFDFNAEANVPAFYSSVALFISAILLGVISVGERRRHRPWRHWAGLASIFLFLTVDEFSSLHEQLNTPVRETLDTSGYLHFAWVVPYSILGLVLLFTYARFLLRLPRHVAGLFMLSGSIFVTGAIGLEMVGSSIAAAESTHTGAYALTTTAEELLEMVGVALFIYALLVYASEKLGGLSLSLAAREGQQRYSAAHHPSAPDLKPARSKANVDKAA